MPSKSLLVFMLLALAVPASAQIVAFNEPFDNNGAGWTFVAPVTPGGGVSEWAIGPATAGGGVSFGNPDPGIDASASAANGVAGVVIGGDAAANQPERGRQPVEHVDLDGVLALADQAFGDIAAGGAAAHNGDFQCRHTDTLPRQCSLTYS